MTKKGRIAASALVLGVPWAAGCSGDDDALERACRVVVEECGVGEAVGDCIDALAGEPAACWQCIHDAGCGYAEQCDDAADRCRLPAELLGEP